MEHVYLHGIMTPEPEGVTCAYCGRPAEGRFQVEDHDGNEYPICTLCGAFETPSYDDLVSAAKQRGKFTPHVPDAWRGYKAGGCALCGVKRKLPVGDFEMALRGGYRPGVWRVQGLKVCEQCATFHPHEQLLQAIWILEAGLPAEVKVENLVNPHWNAKIAALRNAPRTIVPPPIDPGPEAPLTASDSLNEKIRKVSTLFAKE
jgi:hypothetical protein